jgi:hypothetical protein
VRRHNIGGATLKVALSVIVMTYNGTLRDLLRQSNKRLNKRLARYLRDMQPFVCMMTLAYRKGAMNEADPLNRRVDFVH